jgi:hypothetical protein
VPGRYHECSCCDCNTCAGRFLCGLYECVCCPDPCYEPKWCYLADAAFFVDGVRPVTQLRFRYDGQFDVQRPDRAEYFFARENTKPKQLEPNGTCFRHGTGKGPTCIARTADFEDFSVYAEGAISRFSIFVETPYREVGPETAAISYTLDPVNGGCCNRSGFADMNVGTKSLLLDCELLQIAFQFKVYIPTGNFLQGLGTAHTSLEPSLIFGLNLSPDSYFQAQLAYWFPIGGDDLYQGNVFHAHTSYNHVLCRILPDVVLVGTAECNYWGVIGGNYTETDYLGVGADGKLAPFAVSATACMFSAGPGVRLFICDKIDFGVGSAFSFTGDRFAREQVRAEFRWRF